MSLPLPVTVDQVTRSQGVGLADVKRVIPRALYRPVPSRSWGALTRVLLTLAVFPLLLSGIELQAGAAMLWQVPALVVLWVLQGWTMVGLFVLGHDCGHGAFSERRSVNRLVGHLCMAPLANSFQAWVVTHDHHHAHTQLRGQEVDWAANLRTAAELSGTTWRRDFVTRLGYAAPFGIFLWIGWNMIRRGVMIHTMVPPERLAREHRRLRVSSLVTATTLLAIYGGLWWFAGFWPMLKYYGLPGTVATVTGALIITIQHATEHTLLYSAKGWTPVRGQLVSTFDIRFPRVLEWLWCNINIHIPHHVAPTIPWYHLPEASMAVRSAWPELYQEQRFTLRHLAWFRRTPVLREHPEEGYYSLVTG